MNQKGHYPRWAWPNQAYSWKDGRGVRDRSQEDFLVALKKQNAMLWRRPHARGRPQQKVSKKVGTKCSHHRELWLAFPEQAILEDHKQWAWKDEITAQLTSWLQPCEAPSRGPTKPCWTLQPWKHVHLSFEVSGNLFLSNGNELRTHITYFTGLLGGLGKRYAKHLACRRPLINDSF